MGGSNNRKSRFNAEITNRILIYLEENRFASITEVAMGAGTTRITAKKHLERLFREGILSEKRMGIFRIFYRRNVK